MAIPLLAQAPAEVESAPIVATTLYRALLSERDNEAQRSLAPQFLRKQLARVKNSQCDLPDDLEHLAPWLEQQAAAVGRQYQSYLHERRQSASRRYFGCKSQALYFLRCIAPTKLVDGAWLYGLLAHWDDPRFAALIRTYLDELGRGEPRQNHVLIYRKLLAAQGCEDGPALADDLYLQGTIQLALAHNAEQFLPELIGYNLGYEQLPLHLLITAHELREFDIDPYYFTLHVTVDNADSGHARQAARAVQQAQPTLGRERFARRLANGYRLNQIGPDPQSIVDGFDLHREVVAMFANKAQAGRFMHCQASRIGGRPLSQWLAEPTRMPALLEAMQQTGWIKRHQPPAESRFWRLIHGEQPVMYGVFTAYEKQVIFDWITGDWPQPDEHKQCGIASLSDARSLRSAHPISAAAPASNGDVDRETQLLEQALIRAPDSNARMQVLTAHMSPARHHRPAGLMATRRFAQVF